MCVQLRNRVLGRVVPGVKGGRDAPADSHRLVQRQPRVQGALEGHVDPARGVEAERLMACLAVRDRIGAAVAPRVERGAVQGRRRRDRRLRGCAECQRGREVEQDDPESARGELRRDRRGTQRAAGGSRDRGRKVDLEIALEGELEGLQAATAEVEPAAAEEGVVPDRGHLWRQRRGDRHVVERSGLTPGARHGCVRLCVDGLCPHGVTAHVVHGAVVVGVRGSPWGHREGERAVPVVIDRVDEADQTRRQIGGRAEYGDLVRHRRRCLYDDVVHLSAARIASDGDNLLRRYLDGLTVGVEQSSSRR